MFDIRTYLDAAAPAIFSMFALWAAGSTRHWFVRTSVATAALLFVLLLPAYELVITFGTEMLMVVAGLSWWRRRLEKRSRLVDQAANKSTRPQLSLETLMLLTVVVAVTTAVLARAGMSSVQWLFSVNAGLQAGAAALLCAWLILGETRWAIRVALAVPLSIALVACMWVVDFGRDVLYCWWVGQLNTTWLSQSLTTSEVKRRLQDHAVMLALAMPMICGWLYLMVQSGWFRNFRRTDATISIPPSAHRRTMIARGALVAWTIAVMAIPVYIFCLLMLPHSTEVPEHAVGYADLVAAGKMIGEANAVRLVERHQRQFTNNQLHVELESQAAAFHSLRKAFADPAPAVEGFTFDDAKVVRHLAWAIDAKIDLAERMQSPSMLTEAAIESLGLWSILDRESDFNATYEVEGVNYLLTRTLWRNRSTLDATQLREIGNALQDLDLAMTPWDEIERQERARIDRSGWKARLRLILDDWTRTDRFTGERAQHQMAVATVRLLMVELAIDAFQQKNARLPHDLDELVPKYLVAIPLDPFGNGPLRYRMNGEMHVVYSVGQDGDDDSVLLAPSANRGEGDLTAELLLR